jgi:hypothetical protein
VVPPCLAHWLTWGLTNFFPRLASNCDPPNFCLWVRISLSFLIFQIFNVLGLKFTFLTDCSKLLYCLPERTMSILGHLSSPQAFVLNFHGPNVFHFFPSPKESFLTAFVLACIFLQRLPEKHHLKSSVWPPISGFIFEKLHRVKILLHLWTGIVLANS